MRTLKLVNDLEYNKKFKEINGKLDFNNYSYMIENSERTLYQAEEIVDIDAIYQGIVEKVVQGYIDKFASWNATPTQAQIDFARTTAKILLGKLKNQETIPVIPAPCGFGKSTVTNVFIKEVCLAIKDDLISEGLIIVTDKLEQLKSIHNEVLSEIGYYYTEKVENREYKTPFTYVLEGWTDKSFDEGVCLNKNVKAYKAHMCTDDNCPFFSECKISKQSKQQQFSPILLMTNARLESFGDSINSYCYYYNKDKQRVERTLLINDEKPAMIDSVPVSLKLMNDIQNDIYNLPTNSDVEKSEKELLKSMWKEIRSRIESKLNSYSKHERMIVSNITNEPILLNDDEFVQLWDKHMKLNYKNELKHIHIVLTRGGLYCNTPKNGDFINTIGMKEIVNENYKTVIFDATALVDPDYASDTGGAYEDIVKFVDIDNYRDFGNLTFNFYQMHKINKSQFRNKRYLAKACVSFLESLPTDKLTYVVTYKDVAAEMLKIIKDRKKILIRNSDKDFWGKSNKVEIVTYDAYTVFYFGNTKGSNRAKDALTMAQFGWNTLPDYIYATRYLCTDFTNEKINEILNRCTNVKTAENFANFLKHGEDYKFINPNLYIYQHYSMLTDFIQEVFRTKLRQYDCNDSIEINCFQVDPVLIGMIKQLFPSAEVNTLRIELDVFKAEKVEDRKNGDKASTLKKYIEDTWQVGQEVTTKEICSTTGLTSQDIDNLKRKNSYFRGIFDKYKVKRGRFVKS